MKLSVSIDLVGDPTRHRLEFQPSMEPLLVGRDPESDVVVSDLRVSRSHGTLRWDGKQWEFDDLERSSGTYCDGTRIRTVVIQSRTVVHLGSPDGVVLSLSVAPVEPHLNDVPATESTSAHTGAVETEAVATGTDITAGFVAEPSDEAPTTLSQSLGLIPASSREAAADSEAVVPSPVVADGIRKTEPFVQTIGRAADNTIVLSELVVSRHHAQLSCSGDQCWIADFDSHHGTYVDGRSVHGSVAVTAESRITIGSTALRLVGGALTILPDDSHFAGLETRHLTVTLGSGQRILDDVSFSTPTGTFLAIVGPTGAGKSTLLKAITGFRPPDAGDVFVDGRSLYANFEELRLQIGYVPQDDILHPQLTVRTALQFGAELRFPSETTATERSARVDEVMKELGLTPRANLRIDRLSGGQRKRTSVALELLTKPRLLFLDEPTSGLDPGYEQSVMELLRELANGGRVVAVVTHSLASLALCNKVLFLAPGGRTAYFGPPEKALSHFGLPDYPAVFRSLELSGPATSVAGAEPRHRRVPESGVDKTDVPAVDWRGQLSTLVRRQFSVLAADRRNLLILALAPLLPAILILALAGSGALNPTHPGTSARTLLGALVITAAALGAANGLREIVKEQAIYERERAVGLRRSVYLVSKLVSLGAVTALQCALLTVVATETAGGPTSSNLLPPKLELVADVAATGLAMVSFGLLISALVSTSEKAMALIPVVFVVSWLFSGIALGLGGKPVLSQAAYLAPANWGVSAAASTADLPSLENNVCGTAPTPSASASATTSSGPAAGSGGCDVRWKRGTAIWLGDLISLAVLGGAFFLGADWALARKEPLEEERARSALAVACRAARRRFGIYATDQQPP